MSNEELKLKKGASSFKLTGRPIFTDNTFTLDKVSESGYHSNRMGLGIDCGKGNIVFAQMFDGYNDDKMIYAHGTKADEKNPKRMVDDYEDKITVKWGDRFVPDILDDIGPSCYKTVELTKKLGVQKYLSEYDAVAYIAEMVDKMSDEEKADLVLDVRGDLEYSYYDGKITCKKNITSIRVNEKVKESNFSSSFTQTVYANTDSLGKPDMASKTFPLTVKVPQYISKYNVTPVKATVPLEYEMQLDAKSGAVAKYIANTIKKSSGWSKFTFSGVFIESGSSEDFDLTTLENYEEVQKFIDDGVLSKDDVVAQVAGNTKRTQIMSVTHCKANSDGLPQVETNIYKNKEMENFEELFYSVVRASDSDDNNDDKNATKDTTSRDTQENSPEDDPMGWMTQFA